MKDDLSIAGVDLSEPKPGQLLPPRAFTSARLYEAESRAIFDRSWIHVADLTDLRSPGDYATSTIGRTPILVTRGDDGGLRGFLNACRHRGSQIVEGRGSCQGRLRCPYHSWTYSLDGRLVGVPLRQDFQCGLDEISLVPVRIATLGPLVFACLAPDTPALSQWAGELAREMDRVADGPLELAYEGTFPARANWKVCAENALESYHVRSIHDLLPNLLDTEKVTHHCRSYGSYSESPAPQEEGVDARPIHFGFLFPNLVYSMTSVDVLTYLRIDPLGPDQVRIEGRGFDRGEDSQALPRELRRRIFERTTKQDIAAVERCQRGLNARGLPRGVHSVSVEARVGHFEGMVRSALRDAVPDA